MPAEFVIDTERRLILTTFQGRLTDADVVSMEAALRRDPRYVPTFDHLMDASGVTELALSGEGIRHVVTVTPNGSGCAGRRVIVAPTDALFGMARMFQTLREADASALAIVRTRAEADALLAGGGSASHVGAERPLAAAAPA